jgi:hypothetical protein
VQVENVKVRYLSSLGLPQRVLTVAFRKVKRDAIPQVELVSEYYVDYQFALNRIATSKQLLLDQRLREIMTKQEFNELQKKFKKRFRGDQHNKRVARQIAIGRLLENPYTVPCESENGYEEVLHAMLTWARKNDQLKYENILYAALERFEINKRNRKANLGA